jgi:hypothetical protein
VRGDLVEGAPADAEVVGGDPGFLKAVPGIQQQQSRQDPGRSD